MCLSVCAYCAYVYMYVHMYVRMYACVHPSIMNVCVFINEYTCMHECMSASVCARACMRVYIHPSTYVLYIICAYVCMDLETLSSPFDSCLLCCGFKANCNYNSRVYL